MEESGCVHINFGIESLSQKMLDVMDKKTTVQENINAIKAVLQVQYFYYNWLGDWNARRNRTDNTGNN